MNIALAQLNPVVGDLTGNIARARDLYHKVPPDCDLVIFPELYLVGYPPRDLLAEPWFTDRLPDAIEQMAAITRGNKTGLLFGAPVTSNRPSGLGLANAAILAANGKVQFIQPKSLLPTYDVFDEARYFDPADRIEICPFRELQLGITVCEDAWNDPEMWARPMYDYDPVADLAGRGVDLLINISASPFHLGKESIRFRLIQNHAKRHGLPFLFVNQVGGNDELIFDGHSMAFDKAGHVIAILNGFSEDLRIINTETSSVIPANAGIHPESPGGPPLAGGFASPDASSSRAGGPPFMVGLSSSSPETPDEAFSLPPMQALHNALVLGIRDYMHKCGFKDALIGLSGGVDSAVVAALAVEAAGPDHVIGVTMPSPYSDPVSSNLAEELADNLGMRFMEIPIDRVYTAFRDHLDPELDLQRSEINLAMENLQARIRGNLLMTLSNQWGALVLSTGNKSEVATGYCTLYGDMAGGLAAISDVPKTMVWELARYCNRERELIPNGIITRPPTAELRPNQLDQDTLPPYEILDAILNYYIERRWSAEAIIKAGYDEKVVRWVIKTVNRNEYKRRQAAPGLKVTSRAFGLGRRMPIAARYE